MPFPPQNPLPYTSDGIKRLHAGQKGCYGLTQRGAAGEAWIYVGKADDIRARLLQHLNGDNPCITAYLPTHVVAMVTAENVEQEKALILEYDPHCNKKVG
jgi:excinuclease UvrABC nuclease subunit